MATYIVTSNADGAINSSNDATELTLREALALAAANPGADTITFDPSVFETVDGDGDPVVATITLDADEGQLLVDSNVTVTGSANGLIVDAGGNSRIFDVTVGTVVMSNLTVTGGSVTGEDGGAIRVANGASLSLTDSTVSNSASTDQNGGGIAADGILTLSNVTINNNTASVDGGGVAIGATGIATMTNVTVASNGATNGDGGGIANAGTATITNATVTGNQAFDTDDNDDSTGGGIYDTGTLNLRNSLVLGNDADGAVSEIDGTLEQDESNVTTGAAADIFATTVTVNSTNGGVLADNDGPVQTVALKAVQGNAALDAADEAFAPDTDARGEARPVEDGDDIGAYELEYEAPTAEDDTASVDEDETINVPLAQGVLANDTPATPGKVLAVESVDDANDGDDSDAVASPTGGEFTVTGEFGTLTLNAANGSYTYVADNADGLATGETATDAFDYIVSEGDNFESTATLTITVTGVNEDPTAGADTVQPDGTEEDLFANDSDTDDDDLTVVEAGVKDGTLAAVAGGSSITVEGTYGTLTIGSDGKASYAKDDAKLASLGGTASDTDVFTYKVSDGNGGEVEADITVTVNGTNDDPTATDITISADDADAGDSATVMGGVSDVDDGDTLTVTQIRVGTDGSDEAVGSSKTISGTYGDLTITSGGTYFFTPDATKMIPLNEGEVGESVFTFTVSDGTDTTTATLTVQVTGENSAPSVDPDTGSTAAAEAEATGTLTITDPDDDGDEDSASVTEVSFDHDTDDTLDVTEAVGADPVTVAGKYGSLTIAADGTWTYVDSGSLTATESETDAFDVTVTDEFNATDTATITVTVTGADDAPVAVDDSITAAAAAAGANVLDNDSDLDASESLSVNNIKLAGDVGAGTNVTTETSINGSTGILTIDTDGSYSFTKFAGADADEKGVLETFEYQVTDGSGSDDVTATLTIYAMAEAVDDAFSMADAAEGDNVLTNDEAAVSTGGTLEVSGIRFGEGDVVAVTDEAQGVLMGAYGQATIGKDGAFSYAAMGDTYAALDMGETADDVFTYTVTDGSATDTATITVTVTGVNDLPTAQDVTVMHSDAEAGDSASLSGAFADVDGASAPTVTGIAVDGDETTTTVSASGTLVQGTHGILSIMSDGSYSYQAADDAAVTIGAGNTGTDAFEYTVTDADGGMATATLSVTIAGQAAVPAGETKIGSDAGEKIRGGDGADTIRGGRGEDRLVGKAGDDVLDGGSGDDVVKGGDGADQLRGGSGRDKLKGGSGDDRLEGEAGNDKLFGGDGADRFVFGEGVDRIRDFSSEDTLELSTGLWDGDLTVEDVVAQFATAKENKKGETKVMFDFGGGDEIRIKGEDLSLDLIESAIVFG